MLERELAKHTESPEQLDGELQELKETIVAAETVKVVDEPTTVALLAKWLNDLGTDAVLDFCTGGAVRSDQSFAQRLYDYGVRIDAASPVTDDELKAVPVAPTEGDKT